MAKKFVGLDGLKHFWTKAKTWIAGQITAEVTAKIAELVANAPEDLDTLKEIADWINTHADSASAMNTQISTNASDISDLKTSVAGKAAASHTHTKSEISDFAHTHDDYLPNSGLSTKGFTKDDNNGLPVYHIMYDCTDVVIAGSGAKVVGFEGIAVDTGVGGYPIGSTQAITALTGWSNAFLILRHSCLTETGGLITPVILKHTDGSSTKYYIALRVIGSGRGIRLFGLFSGEYIGTNILALDGNEALPYGYELYKSSELSGRVKYADSAEYGTFGVLGGAEMAASSNFVDLLNNELCSNTSGGLMGGSICTTTASLGIGAGWWNFLYIPHRNGRGGGDNWLYGTLFVTPMTSNSGTFYIIHRINGINYNAFHYEATPNK